MRDARRVIVAMGSLLMACGPERGELSEALDELCGEATPRTPTSPFTFNVRDPEHAKSGIWSLVPRR